MKPPGFLDAYRSFALVSNRLSLDIPQSISVTDLEKSIRVQLEAICRIVQKYDNEKLQNIYGCNIMLFLGSTTPKFLSKLPILQANIKCIETGVALQNLAGVLELQLPLSVSSDTERQADHRLAALALPLPVSQPGPLDELRYIPGAPLAFASGNSRVYRNQTDLIGQVDNNRRFSSTVLNDLASTLQGQSNSVQGLICIPLFDYFSPNSPIAIGVLNIHKSQSDEQIEEKFSNLGPLLAPMVLNLERLVSIYP